ncbi:uncharacterized protein [Struthio camelus]|uniref:uncharacterized protein n=1 Tax=Struthio camelus TaxID=8801 RepID=UPI003603EE98
MITRPSWDPEEWDGNIWSTSSDSEIDFGLEGEPATPQDPPLVQLKGERQVDGNTVEQSRTYTPKELCEFLTTFQQQPGESLLAWLVRAWDAGAGSLTLLREELNSMSPLSTNAQVQYYLTQLTSVRDGAGNVIEAPTLDQWLCAAVVGANPSTGELATTVGVWRTFEEGINALRQLGVATGLADADRPDGVEITWQMKTQLLRGAPSALKPLLLGTVMPATGSVGALVNNIRDLALVGGPDTKQARAAWNSKVKKLAGTTKLSGKVTRRQMWTDLLQAGGLCDEINGLSTADLFKRWQRLPANQQYRTQPTVPPAPATAWKLPAKRQ